MNTVRVTTASAAYDVLVGEGLTARLGELIAARLERPARRVFVAHDAGLSAAHVHNAMASLRSVGFSPSGVAVVAEETRKTLPEVERLLAEIAATRHERFEPIVALGGGIVGDLAGFAASIYRRVVPVVQCPTTLLSMVDAAVGGKTGANLRSGDGAGDSESLKKNFVGAFHQPMLVVADVLSIASLPPRQLRAGLAECIKHGMIAGDPGIAGGNAAGGDLFAWMEAHLAGVLQRDAGVLAELITRNVQVKAAVVGTDEREELPASAGGRALLNLGHTFGHAIETIASLTPDGDAAYAPLHHGEAVAVGLVAASRCAVSAGLARRELGDAVERVVTAAGLPIRLGGLPSGEALIARMSHDKKVVAGKLRLVLPVGERPGTCRVVEDIDVTHIEAGWNAVRA